ncbi:hypothetical protein AYL99_05857 [Fonsecaea erecta]|uniref:C2H2-type domain-containing protein n=1 Tax=Fonsecaea erecta TaxID=1367422 RepID=A0A178ZPC3_9EURO|nr:hypothetical protein AYL99_05857 [Fonsecaea erecta]OAP60855.1 hypothetical protein AYL99_05857 [Fonsecaea erecta]
MQSPAQAYMSSPATNSPSQIGLSYMGQDSPYQDQLPTPYEMAKLLENLLSAGLSHKQISCLCKPKNFNQLVTIANADENVVQAAWKIVYQRREGAKTRKLSSGAAMRYAPGNASLGPNKPQWSAPTDPSTSTIETYAAGFTNLIQGQPQPSMWHNVSGEMDAMISRDPAVHGDGTTIAPTMSFTAPNFEQPQRADLHQPANANTTGVTSVYPYHALVDVSSFSGAGNASVSYVASTPATYYSAGGKATHDNRPSAASTDSTDRPIHQRTVKKEQTGHPCSEPDCEKKKRFLRSTELGKHLQGDHEQDTIHICQHDDDCAMQTYRHASWGRHHSRDHDSCKQGDMCVKIIRVREKRYWGCSICVHLSEDVSSHAEHHINHFKDGAAQACDIKYSTMILSLLLQEATKSKWEAYSLAMGIQAGNWDLAWQPPVKEIRTALEYGTYQGSDISDPAVAERLITALFASMSFKRKWDEADLDGLDNIWLNVDSRNNCTSFPDTTSVEFNGNH